MGDDSGNQPFTCSTKPHRGLPHEGQQQEEERDDRQDVHQRAEGLVGLRQLGQRGAVGSETGQQEVRHGELGPLERPGAVEGNYHGWACGEPDLPGATSSAKQPAALAWALAGVERCRVGLHGGAAARGVRGGGRPGLGGCGPADRRARHLVGGGMPAAASSCARLRAAFGRFQGQTGGRQGLPRIANGLYSPWRRSRERCCR